ncbi:MazG nucleotide pyrophosphohydrolase domain-containing protein [Kocuria tytonicola]|uniref:MazG nucleotide pyrophosphohydrolase domain-containing protein n=1 Tax=Kocuria tytonicola TaxID=2055946 RepID=UPI003F6B6840
MSAAAGPGAQFERLVAVMDTLRSPGGCPWDAEQTHESLLRYLVEEAYEVVEAVEALEPSARRRDELVEELGDVLLQVVFHARIGQEHQGEQRFDVTDVVTAVTEKLVRRHPGVFDREPGCAAAPESGPPPAPGDPTAAAAEGVAREAAAGAAGDSADRTGRGGASASGGAAASSGTERPSTAELSARWDAVKREEKPQRTRVFDGIPPALPALALAEKALSKARRHGVPGVTPVGPEPSAGQRAAEERELGEQLLRRVEAASARGLDAERALRAAVRRYVAENDGPLDG